MADPTTDPGAETSDNPGTAQVTAREHQPTTATTPRDWLVVYLKGVFMGAADTVPGVSGGTIALIVGIYERLVTAIAALDLDLARHALRATRRDGRRDFLAALKRADVAFLVVLGLGILTAILVVSGVVAFGLETYRAPTNAFFFGLIAASAVVLYGEVSLDTPRRWLAAVLAAGFAFWLTGATAGGAVPHGLVIVLLSGVVTSSAMLLPGISGAALLYILGQYEFMVESLHAFVSALTGVVTGSPTTALVPAGGVVVTFLVGVAVGLVTVAHAVRWALRYDRRTTLTVLVSLMVGALRLPAAEVLAATPRWTPAAAAVVLLSAIVGAVLVLALDRYTEELDYGATEAD